jgi:2',3'-cyclic-nucleotide 2'-phosphodiesterase (5'-nucleotidase family)
MNKKVLFLGVLSVVVMWGCAPKHYELTGVERTRIIVDNRYDQNPDEAAAQFIKPYKRINDSIMGPVMGVVAHNMHADRPESYLSNLLADILIWAAKDYNEQPVLAVYNMGGIRADLTKGEVTYGDVLDVAPFENKIAFTTLSGETVMELFSQIASTGGEGLSKGVKLVITKDYKLKSATLNGEPIDPKRDYRITTIDYLLGGTDKITAFKKGTNVNSPQEKLNNTRFIIMNYFREFQQHGLEVDAQIEGRITVE